MRSWFKILLVPAAVALAGATATAAPGLVGAAPPANAADARAGGDVTLAHHTYWHSRRQWERRHWRRHHYAPYRYHYRPYRYYYYGPRCYWSHYWHRTVCR